MISKSIDLVEESDLVSLISDEARESRSIEFKQSLNIGSDGDKREFLADVSSLANASGGDLIFGIRDEDGIAKELTGFGSFDNDRDTLRIEEIIRNGIQPRITGCKIKSFELSNGQNALVIRLPNSLNKPHMVTFKGSSKFFSRNSAGKYPLDVHEIRSAFVASESLYDRINYFRTERIDTVLQGNTPVPLDGKSMICLHLIPLDSFSPEPNFDISSVQSSGDHIQPMHCSTFTTRNNFDGLITNTPGNLVKSEGYVQIFRNGIIEAVDSRLLSHTDREGNGCLSRGFEDPIISALDQFRDFSLKHSIQPPTAIGLSLLNVRGFQMTGAQGDYRISEQRSPIDREHLILTQIYTENYEFDSKSIMKETFDQVWNACNFEGSPNY